MAQTAGYRTPRFLTFKQALELGGNVRRGEHGTKVYFVKQLHVHDKEGSDDNSATRLVPMMREYTVFNVDQCENLPDSIYTEKPMRLRNPDMRDEFAGAFLHSTGADIREGQGEAFYVPSLLVGEDEYSITTDRRTICRRHERGGGDRSSEVLISFPHPDCLASENLMG
jgi:antirestriction protein ArdC